MVQLGSSLGRGRRGNLRRRLGLPLAILAVAAIVAAWASMRTVGGMEDVEAKLRALCMEAGAGADLTGRLNEENPAIERRINAALRSVCDSAQTAAIVKITVTPGDTSGLVSSLIQAKPTHTALIGVGGEDYLGLQVLHRGESEPLVILGYWDPTQVRSGR